MRETCKFDAFLINILSNKLTAGLLASDSENH
jgi:hypothetical protein